MNRIFGTGLVSTAVIEPTSWLTCAWGGKWIKLRPLYRDKGRYRPNISRLGRCTPYVGSRSGVHYNGPVSSVGDTWTCWWYSINHFFESGKTAHRMKWKKMETVGIVTKGWLRRLHRLVPCVWFRCEKTLINQSMSVLASLRLNCYYNKAIRQSVKDRSLSNLYATHV